MLAVSLSTVACEKEDCFEAREACPIPTELPAETCHDAHTFGAMFDTILFVANYAPNNSGIGSFVPEGGLKARWEPGGESILVEAQHAIRPREVDPRFGRAYMTVRAGTMTRLTLSYGMELFNSVSFKSQPDLPLVSELTYDAKTGILCGTFSGSLLVVGDAYDYKDGDTINVSGGVIDTEVLGRP